VAEVVGGLGGHTYRVRVRVRREEGGGREGGRREE